MGTQTSTPMIRPQAPGNMSLSSIVLDEGSTLYLLSGKVISEIITPEGEFYCDTQQMSLKPILGI